MTTTFDKTKIEGRRKIGNNDECPCGSGKKYKRCCKSKIDWQKLTDDNDPDSARHLTLRGKNLMFLGAILAALQIDTLRPGIPFSQVKRAFTPEAVRKIYSAIPAFWPDLADYENCLANETNRADA